MLLALLCAPAVGFAQDGGATAPADQSDYSTWGDLRWIGSYVSDFPVDADGTTPGQTLWLDQRLRAGVGADYGTWGWQIEADVLTGQLAGPTWDLGSLDERHRDEHGALTLDGLMPRKAFVKGQVGHVELKGGLMTSHWGLGLLANDGDHEPLFGRTDLGDRVFRAQATWMPAPTAHGQDVFAAAADLVLEDGTASLYRNQWATQGILAALHVTPKHGQHGVYVVFRQQWNRDTARTLTVGVADGFFDEPVPVGQWKGRIAGEAVGIVGSTDSATTYASPQRTGVLQGGAVLHASLTCPCDHFHAHLIAGYASGDANVDDKWNREFTFNSNYDVGLVLFDQVQGGIDARTYQQLSDPTMAGQAPDGADQLVREGAVHGATFVQPAVQFTGIQDVDLRVGGLFAWSSGPYASPWYSFRNGGVATNPYDVPTPGPYLGTEVDWAVSYAHAVYETLTPSIGVQGGHLFPGPALQGIDKPVISHLMATARLRW